MALGDRGMFLHELTAPKLSLSTLYLCSTYQTRASEHLAEI